MNIKNQTVQEMLEGFEGLDEYWSKRKLNLWTSIKVKMMVCLILFLKYTYRPIRSLFKGKFDITDGLNIHTGLHLNSRGTKRQETDGNNYLSNDEVKHFEQTGIHGPFKVLEEEEAMNLLEYSFELQKRKFDGQFVLGNSAEILKILEDSGDVSLTHLSLYQALNYKKLWDLLCRPQITEKLASLLGDDVICWRSQYFEKTPKAEGTSWHQAGTFRDVSVNPKLTPIKKIDHGMVQLSVWVALTDATLSNGCLRMLEGSFADGRLEQLAWKIMDNKLNFMLEQSPRMIEKVIKTLKYTPGLFPKTQMLFEIAIQSLPDLFKDLKVRNLEMKAGEAIIFTSLNVHGSYSNQVDIPRIAFSGRYTSNDVQFYKNTEYDFFPSPKGKIKFKTSDLKCIQVIGSDKYGHNHIAERPKDAKEEEEEVVL